ncbi:MAG: hypothetical protein IH991_20850 [Planctomycetes bacterium]|nr:hypothetical protein [Planctomycetota bacterium]
MTSEEAAKTDLPDKEPKAQVDEDAAEFGSNSVRLSAREWIIATSVVLLVVVFTPVVWKWIEPFEPQKDFRVPSELSEDYWTYERFVASATESDRIVVVGDSVVWGEYVDPQHTLSHYLNRLHGETLFANGGLNATHPLALQGLVENYADGISDTRVILHCNLLWMSSEDRDLQTEKEVPFNHPRLVPQFVPRIPTYWASRDIREDMDEGLSIVIDHQIPFRKWVHHLRVAFFDGQDPHSWTLEHPYRNPFAAIRLESPRPKDEPHSNPIPWTERGIKPQDIPWIALNTSLQWQAFRTTAELLLDRGNRVFVIVGPFNEHMLTDASRERYATMKKQVETWLSDKAIPFHAATLLPSGEYADASHPLKAGYARLAKRVYHRANFQSWLGK